MEKILITGGNGFLGSYLAKKSLSSGFAVTVIDDDDLYLPFKLREVYEVFQENKDVVYFRNEIIKTRSVKAALVGLDENEIKTKKLMMFSRYRLNTVRDIYFLIREYGAGVNTSSTSIGRNYYLPYVESIRNFIDIPDFSLFYLPFFMNGDKIVLAFEKNPLSIWRIHESLSNTSYNPTMNEIASKHLRNARGSLDQMAMLIEMSKKYLSHENEAALKKYFKLTKNAYNSGIKLIEGKRLRGEEIIDLYKVGVYHRDPRILGSIFFAIVSYFSPGISSRIFKRALMYLHD